MNVPHPKVGRRELKHWRQLKKSWYIFFFQLPWLPELMLGRDDSNAVGKVIARTSCNKERFGPEEQAIYSVAARREGARSAMVNYYRAMLRHADTIDPGDFTVDVPTLMLWGEEDVAIDINCTVGTEQWVPDLTLKKFPGVSHWVQQDAPDEVNAVLEQWLPRA